MLFRSAGSVAYAAAELFQWNEGLSKTFRRAPQFYAVLVLATILGVSLNFTGIPAVRALYLAAIVNGVISPILLVFIMLLARDRRVLGDQVASWPITLCGWLTTLAMAIAAVALAGSTR